MRNVAKIICPLCGAEISKSNCTKHARRHELHPETFDIPKYKVTHEGLDCQFCGKLCKNNNSLRNHERLCKNNPDKQESPFKNYHRSPDYVTWNKGLTAESDSRVAKNAKSVRESVRKNGSKHKGQKLSEEHKLKISQTIRSKAANGEWHTSLARRMHFEYKGQDLHGSWELSYAKWLDEQNIQWIRNKSRFKYVYQGSNHYYTPDFYLPESETYIEIKGFKTDKDEAKWKQFPKNLILKVLFQEDLLNLGIDIKV